MSEAVLRYDEQGSGVPVVLIHGFPLCRKMWQPQMHALADIGYRVICPDLPGFGESPHFTGPVSMSRYADAVIRLLDELGIDKAVVGGMSMGGYVLLNLAERYPERILAAMFLVTRAAADDQEGKKKRSALIAEVENGNLLIVPDAFAQVLFAAETLERDPRLVSAVREWMEATSVAAIVGGLSAMRDREDYVGKLADFKMPNLVVGADQDLAVPLEHSLALAEGLPEATLKVVPGAGHMANLERPQPFNQALLEFLRQLS